MTSARPTWSFADGVVWGFEERSRVMGIVNVTPDSFSDGGRYFDTEAAVAHGLRLAEEGADAIDVGGESTRPGSHPVSEEDQIHRVVPVIRALRQRLERRDHRISVDTSSARVAAAAIDAGADIVNDITGLRGDPAMPRLVAESGAAVILMHMRGTPLSMQDHPHYADVIREVAAELGASRRSARDAGVKDDRIVLDPGIGFAKSADDNLEILARLPDLAVFGRPLLVGVSRKSFLGTVTGLPVDQRLEAGLGAGAVSIVKGASLLRVHDVEPTVRMVRIVDAIRRAGRTAS